MPASLVVFLVALPLSIGIALASNAPVTAGLIAAAVGGIIGGLLGGSPLTVSGPAAGLTIVVAGLIDQFGFAATCAITVAAGVLQVLLGLGRVARAALAISPAVLHAMLGGIGITIVLGQLHVLLGGSNQGEAWANLEALPHQLADVHGPAAFLGLAVAGLLFGWKYLPPSIRRIPGQLVVIVTMTALSVLLGLDVQRVELPGSLLSAIALPKIPGGSLGAIVLGVLTVTIIASVESLLSAVATDKLSADGRRANLDRELMGQGASNIVSGLLGGLPVTGVIVRSSTNIAAGARTRMSAILHGLWVLLFALALVSLIEQVPMAALAGLLIMLGLGLVKTMDVKAAQRHGELPVYVVTILGVVFLNLLEGVAIGLLLVGLLVVRRALWARVRVVQAGPHHWTVTVDGVLSFVSVPRLAHQLARIPTGSDVTINLEVDYLDHTGSDHLEGWREQHQRGGGTVRIDEIGIGTHQGHNGKRSDRDSLRRHVAPWALWQTEHNAGRALAAHQAEGEADLTSLSALLTGVHEYQTRSAPMMGRMMADLAQGQQPTVLFLTCSDSRVVPNLITGSGPGDLFTIRNIANLVPTTGDDSTIAAIEYAIEVLGISTIVICGHSGCGGMKALLASEDEPPADTALSRWLRAADDSLLAWHATSARSFSSDEQGEAQADALSRINVGVQLERLDALPVVRDAVLAGRLQLAGLFYDLSTAQVELLDRSTSVFAAPAARLSRLVGNTSNGTSA